MLLFVFYTFKISFIKKKKNKNCPDSLNYYTTKREQQLLSGPLLLCFIAFSDWEFLPQGFKKNCYWKIDCGKHYHLSNILSNFQKSQVEQPKQLLHLKKPLNVKFLRLSVQFGLLEPISRTIVKNPAKTVIRKWTLLRKKIFFAHKI